MCNCLLSTRIESAIFSHKDGDMMDILNPNNVPDEECPICLEPLKIPSHDCCCGNYARKLNCGHFVHVTCQINKNPDFIRCSLCRTQLTPNDIYYKICKSILVNKLPLHYQRQFLNGCLSKEVIKELENIYEINYERIKYIFDYVNKNKENELIIKKIFDALTGI